ncbi:MAG: hypothetical protein R6V15_17005 [Desulfotignum sp.]
MLRSANEIIGYKLHVEEEKFGTCEDLLFDDRWWTVRHIVANTGNWLVGKLVLVSPLMIATPDWNTRSLFLSVSKEAVENCPDLSEDEPVSREHEKKFFRHYGYPYYWAGAGLWGPSTYPAAVEPVTTGPATDPEEETEQTEAGEENHLRSFKEVKGYFIKASDGDIGHVQDFILDDETWALRYVVVDTRNWLPGGKKVMLSLNWAKSVNWEDSTFEMDLTTKAIENGPEFDPTMPVNLETETRLYDYYGRPFEKTIDKQLQQHIANPFI